MVCSYPHNTKITQFCQNFALSRSRPSGSAARALVLLEKEGVHLIHGQSATGYDTLLHLGEVGLVEQTSAKQCLLLLQVVYGLGQEVAGEHLFLAAAPVLDFLHQGVKHLVAVVGLPAAQGRHGLQQVVN